jgi:hypothetical protein
MAKPNPLVLKIKDTVLGTTVETHYAILDRTAARSDNTPLLVELKRNNGTFTVYSSADQQAALKKTLDHLFPGPNDKSARNTVKNFLFTCPVYNIAPIVRDTSDRIKVTLTPSASAIRLEFDTARLFLDYAAHAWVAADASCKQRLVIVVDTNGRVAVKLEETTNVLPDITSAERVLLDHLTTAVNSNKQPPLPHMDTEAHSLSGPYTAGSSLQSDAMLRDFILLPLPTKSAARLLLINNTSHIALVVEATNANWTVIVSPANHWAESVHDKDALWKAMVASLTNTASARKAIQDIVARVPVPRLLDVAMLATGDGEPSGGGPVYHHTGALTSAPSKPVATTWAELRAAYIQAATDISIYEQPSYMPKPASATTAALPVFSRNTQSTDLLYRANTPREYDAMLGGLVLAGVTTQTFHSLLSEQHESFDEMLAADPLADTK